MNRRMLRIVVFGLVAAAFTPGATVRAQNAVSGPLRLVVDTPAPNAIVAAPFVVAGWAMDDAATTGTGIDTVHVWATPVSGTPVFLGAATWAARGRTSAPSTAPRFNNSGFTLTVTTVLAPGAYTLQVFGRRISTLTFAIVEQVPITVRGVTLSDLVPCATGQVPRFDGTKWGCADNPGGQGADRTTGTTGTAGRHRCHGSAAPRARGEPAAGAAGATGTTGPAGPGGGDRHDRSRRCGWSDRSDRGDRADRLEQAQSGPPARQVQRGRPAPPDPSRPSRRSARHANLAALANNADVPFTGSSTLPSGVTQNIGGTAPTLADTTSGV